MWTLYIVKYMYLVELWLIPICTSHKYVAALGIAFLNAKGQTLNGFVCSSPRSYALAIKKLLIESHDNDVSGVAINFSNYT